MNKRLIRWPVPVALGLCVGLASGVAPAGALAEPLTASRVAQLAAAQAPEVLLAETQLLGAKGRLAGARAFGEENPVIQGLHGSGDDLDHASELELQIPLGFGLKRLRRVQEAGAGVEREGHLVIDAQRQVVGLALASYYRVLHAEERKRIAQDRRDLADELRRVADERVRTGDAARLELMVAETELSRAESEILTEESNLTQARVELASILGLPSATGIEVSGDLSDRSLFETELSSEGPERRSDVLAAESEVKAAKAEVSLTGLALVPGLSFQLAYQHARSEDIVRPGLEVTLPIFNYGQGARGEARARRERAQVELAGRRAAAAAEAEAARHIYKTAVASARETEERGLPRALETQALAQESYEAGKLDLPGLLVVRGSALDTRREHADQLYEAARAGIDLVVSLGTFPTH